MDIFEFNEPIGPMDFTSTDDLSEFLVEIMGEPIFDTPMDYTTLESDLGRITDEDFFFKTNTVPIIEPDNNEVPFDEVEPVDLPHPIYVCNNDDYVTNAKTNADILFNLILSVSLENNGSLKRKESCLYKLFRDDRKKIMGSIESKLSSESKTSFNIKYNEVNISRKDIVKLLRLERIHKLFGKKILLESTIQGILSALIKKIDKYDVKKIEYTNIQKNSFFTIRVKC